MNGPLVVNQFCVKNFLVKDVYVEKIKVTKIKVKKFKYQQKFSEEQWISQPKLNPIPYGGGGGVFHPLIMVVFALQTCYFIIWLFI